MPCLIRNSRILSYSVIFITQGEDNTLLKFFQQNFVNMLTMIQQWCILAEVNLIQQKGGYGCDEHFDA
jgi:hypothetical protein